MDAERTASAVGLCVLEPQAGVVVVDAEAISDAVADGFEGSAEIVIVEGAGRVPGQGHDGGQAGGWAERGRGLALVPGPAMAGRPMAAGIGLADSAHGQPGGQVSHGPPPAFE